MAPPLDFNATLAEQLRDAGMQMRAMSKPQKSKAPKDDEPASPLAESEAVNGSPNSGARSLADSPENSNVHSDVHSGQKGAPKSGTDSKIGSTHDSATDSISGSRADSGANSAGDSVRSSGQHSACGSTSGSQGDSLDDSHGDSAGTMRAAPSHPTFQSGAQPTADYHAAEAAAEAAAKATLQTGGPLTSTATEQTEHRTGSTTPSATADVTGNETTGAAATKAHAGAVTSLASERSLVASTGAPSGASTDAATGAATKSATESTTATAKVTPTVGTTATATQGVTDTSGAISTDRVTDSITDRVAGVATASRAEGITDEATGSARACATENAAVYEAVTAFSEATVSPAAAPAHTVSVNTGALPDAAYELWAMSHHSAAPTLSERSWTGGVRGAVLDALRGLAGGRDHVLVNLKRLATHTGISYGSVRNAMSRLTRSGDIRTRQIRMADGHGVRVEFLTLPGQEGTGFASGQGFNEQGFGVTAHHAAEAQRAAQYTSPADLATAGMTATMTHGGQHIPLAVAATAQSTAMQQAATQAHARGNLTWNAGHAQSHAGDMPRQDGQYRGEHTHSGPWAEPSWGQANQGAQPPQVEQVHGLPGQTQGQTQGQIQGLMHGQEQTQRADLAQMSPLAQLPQAAQMAHSAHMSSPFMPAAAQVSPAGMQAANATHQEAIPLAASPAATQAATPTVTRHAFWETDETLFALAWPHASAAGLRMDALRALAPLFVLQGFDPAILPRCLRYLDWELEHSGVDACLELEQPLPEEAKLKALAFVRAMQRRGTWPRPADYEGDD